MKYIRLLLVLAIALAGFGFASSAKAGVFTYTSGISLQNLSDATANITLYFYKPDGTIDTTKADTIDPLGSKVYFPIPTSDGFSGSVVIESDVVIASISNILGDGGLAAAAYDGSSSGGSPVLLPLLMHENGNYNTWFNVQNAGGGDADVLVEYSDGITATAVVKPGAAFTFDQLTETHPEAVFSGIVTANQPVAATTIEENPDVMFAYSGFLAGATHPIMPLVNANNSGYITGINIQNTGEVSSTVTVAYDATLFGTDCTETQTIDAGKSATFALYAFAGTPLPGMTTDCAALETFVGSGKVLENTGDVPLTAIVNQLKPGVNGEAYGAFNGGDATSAVVFPLIMNANSGYWTSESLTNVGEISTTVTCSYVPYGDFAPEDDVVTLNPGEGASFLQKAIWGDKLYIGSSTCEASGGGLIVGIVNELGPSGTKDQLLVYEGFNK